MNGELQKSKLSLWTALRIGTHGMLAHPIRLIVVIFLATVALALFGLSLTVALYNEESATIQSIYDYDEQTAIMCEDEEKESAPLTKEFLEEIEEGTGKSFACLTDGVYLSEWWRFVPFNSPVVSQEILSKCMRTDPKSICYVTEQVISEAGFTLTGRLPANKNEIAINGCMLETFLRMGYYDDITFPQKYDDDYQYVYDENCLYTVGSAQELIDLGAKLLLIDPETDERNVATIVGVVEYGTCPYTHSGYSDTNATLVFGLYDQIYVSEDYFLTASQCNYGADTLGIAAVAGKSNSLSEAKTVYQFCKQNGFTLYSESVEKVETYRETISSCAATFAGIGAAFAVFAVLLIYQFVCISIESKKMQIGILRALGARSVDVFKIFLSESMLLALIYAVLAIPLTIVMSKVANYVLKHSFLIAVSVLNFHWLMPVSVLILSIGITLISVIVPVYRLAKKSPVESIRDCN